MLMAAARACACAVFRVDLSKARDKSSLLAAFQRDLALPADFGHNWDALADSLGNPDWQTTPGSGCLLLLEHSDLMARHAADDLATALDICAEAADEWRQRGMAFWCLIDQATVAPLPQN
jgi:RNAse (barnase) inhibitor barstar